MSVSTSAEFALPSEASPSETVGGPQSSVPRVGGWIKRLLDMTRLSAYARVVDRRTRRQLALVAAGSLAASLLEVAALAATIPLIQLLSSGDLAGAGIAGEIAAHVVGDYSRRSQTLIVLAAVVGLMLAKLLLTVLVRWFTIGVITNGATTATVNLFGAYLEAPIEFHARRNVAAAARDSAVSITTVFTTGVLGITTALTEGCLILLVGVLLLVLSPQSVLATAAFFGLAMLVYRRIVPNRMEELAKQHDLLVGRVLVHLQQSLAGLRDIRLRGQEAQRVVEFCELRTEQHILDRSLLFAPEHGRYLMEASFFVGFAILATVQLLVGGDQAIASLAVMLAAGFRILPNAGRLFFAKSCIHEGQGHLSVVTEELDVLGIWRLEAPRPTVTEGVGASRSSPASVEVRNASFRYVGSTLDAISAVSVTVEPGQSLGIVGPSGSGKTTLVDLICGLLVPTAGEVIIDAEPTAAGRRLSHVGYVAQDVFLLDDTILRNIVFSERTVDRIALERAVRLARLDRWIESLPDGLDTMVGERGSLVSGGQRQRIGIARALYRNPTLLVLDEATSALDVETEDELTTAINGLGRSVTIVVIAHRLSTVRGCDRILLLEDGRVAGFGTYEALSREHSTFSRWIDLSRSGRER